MEILADENVETEWIRALRDDGHDVSRVVDVEELGESASDPAVLNVAVQQNRVLLTADQSDFSAPPRENHHGIIVLVDVTRTGGELRRAIRRVEQSYPDISNHVVYVSDWL